MTHVFVRFGSNTTHIPIGRLDELVRGRRDVRLLLAGRPLGIELLRNLPADCTLTLHQLIAGGKGGFGSLLRAFGKQILISNNKEACRDLNGRRMRDVNNEKKLKEWLLKQADNRSKQDDKLERLKRKRKASPKHCFEDRKYQRQKRMIENELENALDDAFNVLQRRGCQNKRSDDGSARLIGIPEVESEEEESEDKEEEVICISQELYDKLIREDSGMSLRQEEECRLEGEDRLEEEGRLEAIENHAMTGDTSPKGRRKEEIDCHLLTRGEMPPLCDEAKTDLIDLASLASARELLRLGPERLKRELQQRGLKCGGTTLERADRLWAVRDLQEYPRKLLARTRGQ